MKRSAQDQRGTLRGWLLSYNLGMLAIILIATVILFSVLFNLLAQMQSRNSQYEAVNTFSRQLSQHRQLFGLITAEQDSGEQEQLLSELAILGRELQISLHRLAVDFDSDSRRYFIQQGIANGLQFIDENLATLLTMERSEENLEYFSRFYTTDRVYSYLQDYAINQYLPQIVSADIAWILATEHMILNYRGISALLFILIAIIYTIATYEMTMRLVRPVSTMVDTARQIIHGEFDGPQIPIEGPAELQYLEQSMNQMRDSLRKRMEMIEQNALLEKRVHSQEIERIKTTRELEKARYNALQSQINPHFLFNTLNIISRTALFEGANTTVDLLDTLSSIFRYTLQHQDDVTLKEELQFVRKYLTIQQYRFKERLSFTIEADPALDEVRIPPLIIQPFVENAMIHGLEPKVEGGKVSITATRKGRTVMLTVEDSGVGIDLEWFKKSPKKEREHIGIKNITDRLQLYYKRKASVEVERISEAGGTRVTLTLPYRSGGKVDVHVAHSG